MNFTLSFMDLNGKLLSGLSPTFLLFMSPLLQLLILTTEIFKKKFQISTQDIFTAEFYITYIINNDI